MAFILVSKENGKTMRVVGGNLESQKTIRTSTIFPDKLKDIILKDMGDKVEVRYIQVNSVQSKMIENCNGYIQRSTLNKLENEYMNIWRLAQ